MVILLPNRNVSLQEFMGKLDALDVTPHLRFRRTQSGDPDEHDWIFLVCRQEPNRGSHIGRTCTCCNDNSSINDYESFKESMSEEHYNSILDLLFDFTYTDVDYKASRN